EVSGDIGLAPAADALGGRGDIVHAALAFRLAIGGWKFLYLSDQPRVALAKSEDKIKRGQYLVEGPGHCGECHTPRDALGGFK
ncbi:diacylglycerol kinase, partial [Rhizobium ruizarguesonis]